MSRKGDIKMPKRSKESFEKDEKKILRELLKDSSQSIDTIAKGLSFSRQKVWSNIKRLKAEGVIWGYTAVINEEKLGIKNYFALIKRSTHPLSEELTSKIIERNIGRSAKKIGVTIENSCYTHGSYDWIVGFTAENVKQAKKFCDVLYKTYLMYIADIQLLEGLFWVRKHGLLNPKKEKLKEFT